MSTQPSYFGPPGFASPPQDIGVWRSERMVIFRQGAPLPPMCIKCGAPAAGKPYRRRLSWHEPALYLLILAGLLIYVIVALVVRKTGPADVCLCAKHRARRKAMIWAAWLTLLGGIGLCVLAGVLETGEPALFGVLVLFASLVLAAINSQLVTASKIDDYYITLKGAGEGYRRLLPWVDGRDIVVSPVPMPMQPPLVSAPTPPPLPPRPRQ